MDICGQIIEADLTWNGETFEEGLQLKCDHEGKIEAIGRNLGSNIIRLKGQALLPGMVSAHSHAFQRGLRGQSHIGQKSADSFWGWRQEMYQNVSEMTPAKFYDVCKSTFEEMLCAGITTVGEFHYFHHSQIEGNNLYDLDKVILKAAKDTGIRLVLLETLYQWAGLKREQTLDPAQTRFMSQSLEEFWKNLDELSQSINLEDNQTLGVAAHSIRAVDPETLIAFRDESRKRGLPFHMHMEEQPQEIKDSISVLGKTPSRFVLDNLNPDRNFTGVHCTFTDPKELEELINSGANICICPLTEGYLGDGIPTLPGRTEKPFFACLGSDCNNRISMAEEMHWFAYLQQVKNNKRGVECLSGSLSNQLFKIATENGSRSVGLAGKVGKLDPGFFLDFFTVDLGCPILENFTPDTLLDSFIFGTSGELPIVSGHCVGGKLKAKIDMIEKKTTTTVPSILAGNSVAEFLQWLMSFDSTTGSEETVGVPLTQYLEAHGWSVERQPISDQTAQFNILATRQKHSKPRLIFNSHLDTVPPYIPYSLDGDIIKGRGSCDAKGQIAAIIFAAEKLVKTSKFADDISLLFVCQEETNHIGMRTANKLGLNPEFLIVGEPTELKFAKRQKGMMKLDLRSIGKAAHSGYPEKGISALDPLLDVLEDLRKTEWPGSPSFGQTTMNIGLMKAGKATNVIPADAQASLMFRVVTDPQSLFEQIISVVDGRVEVVLQTKNGPLDLSVPEGYDNMIASFNTDIPYFDGHENTKCFLFGAGSITDAHSDWEFVKVEDLEKAVDVYYDLAMKLLN